MTVTEPVDEGLLKTLARRNWLIFAGLILLSCLWRSWQVSLGVVTGGLLAIVSYHWLHRSLRRLLFASEPGGARRFQFGYLARLAVLAGMLVLLLKSGIHPIGLAAGLSVVVLSIIWTTVKRAI